MLNVKKNVVRVTDFIDESVNSVLPLRGCGLRASLVDAMHHGQAIGAKEHLSTSEPMSPRTNSYCDSDRLTQRHASASRAETGNLLHVLGPR